MNGDNKSTIYYRVCKMFEHYLNICQGSNLLQRPFFRWIPENFFKMNYLVFFHQYSFVFHLSCLKSCNEVNISRGLSDHYPVIRTIQLLAVLLHTKFASLSAKVFLFTPPFTQLNTPYPATAYLKVQPAAIVFLVKI